MITMGIDQSYNSTGCVIIQNDQIIFDECITIGNNKETDVFDRSYILANYLKDITEKFKPTNVIIEGLAFGIRGDATRDLAGLQFMIINSIRHCNHPISPLIVAPMSLKKFSTGSGRSDKKEMFNHLPEHIKKYFKEIKKYKVSKGLFDMVDAYWLAKFTKDL